MDDAKDGTPRPLPGGTTEGVVRIGDRVHRPMPVNGSFVRALLRHLEQVDLRSVPRERGVDAEGRQVLTYLPGEAHHGEQGGWTDDQLRQAMALLRGFHDATAGTALAGADEVVCHNDFAPWNVVFEGERPTGIIDFEDAGAGPRVRDVSYAAWCWLALGSAPLAVEEQARRLGVVCAAYGIAHDAVLIDEIRVRQREIFDTYARQGRRERARRVAAEMEWVRLHRAGLGGEPGRGHEDRSGG